MATVNVRFVGPWRLYLGTDRCTLKAATIEDFIEQMEAIYGHKYHERLRKGGIKERRSISGDSNILVNRVHIRQLTDHSLKDGDNIDVIARFVGG
ncbi:MAG: MoaD/ThiS family protein [Dehalococcoidia bacterium]|nr:MoaD/ThiS family protein [Dehalococcoidia bacterium]